MKNLFFYIILVLFFASCESDNLTYNVPADFTPYVEKFKSDAKRFGLDFDDKGLIMRFADLEDNVAGLCYYEKKPIVIEIDREYWEKAGKAKNEKDIKEDLIFHEMGHGFLQRFHLNNVLNNGDWKTIMCGGELPNDRGSNINYRGFRKEYYIKELFTSTDEVPEWSTIIPDFSTVNESVILNQDFTESSNWVIGEDDSYKSEIADGNYIFTTKTTNSYYVLNGLGIDVSDDFYFETRLKIEYQEDGTFGMVFGTYDEGESSTNCALHYYMANTTQHVYIGETECLGPFIDLYKEEFNAGDFNTLAVRKQGKILYYYINGKFIYHNDVDDIGIEGNKFGFKVPGNCSLYVDYVKIASSDTSNTRKLIPSVSSIKQASEINTTKWVK